MIYVKELKSWGAFEEEAERLNARTAELLREMMGLPYIYRGQSDAVWPLAMSLERVIQPNQRMLGYYELIRELKPRLRSVTGRSWKLPSLEKYRAWVMDPVCNVYSIPALDYMAFLRHNGFPSPLLDWTYSPYIAAFFAFGSPGSKAKSVAIFQYYMSFEDERLERQPKIFRLEGAWRTDRRHAIQQSVYTICCNGGPNWPMKGEPYYASHEDLYAVRDADKSREYVTKYVLPAGEREAALSSLEGRNINAYSLTGTLESFLETEFVRMRALRQQRAMTAERWKSWWGRCVFHALKRA